jgi:hypothetical protein
MPRSISDEPRHRVVLIEKFRFTLHGVASLRQGVHNRFQFHLFIIEGNEHKFVTFDLESFDSLDFFEDRTYPLRRTSGGATRNGHPNYPLSGKRSLMRQQRQQQDKQAKDRYFSFHESSLG